MECGIRFKIPTILKLPRSITRESVKGFFCGNPRKIDLFGKNK